MPGSRYYAYAAPPRQVPRIPRVAILRLFAEAYYRYRPDHVPEPPEVLFPTVLLSCRSGRTQLCLRAASVRTAVSGCRPGVPCFDPRIRTYPSRGGAPPHPQATPPKGCPVLGAESP